MQIEKTVQTSRLHFHTMYNREPSFKQVVDSWEEQTFTKLLKEKASRKRNLSNLKPVVNNSTLLNRDFLKIEVKNNRIVREVMNQINEDPA